jgi:MFS transporter, PPP family, 3-phenylpropionic acid transporter
VIGYGLPGVLGGLAGGYLTAHWGLQGVFWVTCCVALAATGCAFKVWRLQHPQQALQTG